MSPIKRIDSAVGRVALHGVATTRAREAVALATVPAYTLMARAGAAVARLALALAPHARHVLVFAGPGNNGGDGIEAATRLVGWASARRSSLSAMANGVRPTRPGRSPARSPQVSPSSPSTAAAAKAMTLPTSSSTPCSASAPAALRKA